MLGYIELIDHNMGGRRVDATPSFVDRHATYGLSTDLARPLAGMRLDLVAGIDALGFILGSALACRCQTGFLAIYVDRNVRTLPPLAQYNCMAQEAEECSSLSHRPPAIEKDSMARRITSHVEPALSRR